MGVANTEHPALPGLFSGMLEGVRSFLRVWAEARALRDELAARYPDLPAD